MTLREYIDRLRGKTVAVIGIGVSNTPLLRLLLREGISVTACDRSSPGKAGLHWPASWRLRGKAPAGGRISSESFPGCDLPHPGPAARRAGAGGRPGQGQHHHLRNGGVL